MSANNTSTHDEAQTSRSAIIKIAGEARSVIVSKKCRRDFGIIDNELVCRQCARILSCRERERTDLVRLRPNDSSSILVNPVFLVPHCCLLSTLKQFEAFSQGDLIEYELYNKWMNANSNNYQLGNSADCMKLWDDFTKYIRTNRDSDLGRKIQAPATEAVTLGRCATHNNHYLHIIWDKVRSRADLSVVNSVWAWSSKADHAKTNLSAVDLLWHMTKEPQLKLRYSKWAQLFSIELVNVTVETKESTTQ